MTSDSRLIWSLDSSSVVALKTTPAQSGIEISGHQLQTELAEVSFSELKVDELLAIMLGHKGELAARLSGEDASIFPVGGFGRRPFFTVALGIAQGKRNREITLAESQTFDRLTHVKKSPVRP